ncbi:hypothetical protein Tco_0377128 [Tanacetum coccineum]
MKEQPTTKNGETKNQEHSMKFKGILHLLIRADLLPPCKRLRDPSSTYCHEVSVEVSIEMDIEDSIETRVKGDNNTGRDTRMRRDMPSLVYRISAKIGNSIPTPPSILPRPKDIASDATIHALPTIGRV